MDLPGMTQMRIWKLWRDERAQDGFEYLLIVGVASVGIVAAIAGAGGLIDTVVALVEGAITAL
jgi:Flp pilus assembly pilin Flp